MYPLYHTYRLFQEKRGFFLSSSFDKILSIYKILTKRMFVDNFSKLLLIYSTFSVDNVDNFVDNSIK